MTIGIKVDIVGLVRSTRLACFQSLSASNVHRQWLSKLHQLQRGVEEVERNYLKDVLARHEGKIGDSAKTAGISTRQLNKLMHKYGIRKEEFKPR